MQVSVRLLLVLSPFVLACGDDTFDADAGRALADAAEQDAPSRQDAAEADAGGDIDGVFDGGPDANKTGSDAAVDPEDWARRSTGEGVTMATNFDDASDVFDFAVDDASHYEWSTNIHLSGGGALRILLADDDTTSGWDWWRFLDDSMEPFGSAEDGLRDEYWVSYSVYIPEDYYGWVYDCAGSKKFSITSGHPVNTVNPVTRADFAFPLGPNRRTGSSVVNEIVIDDSQQTMWVTLYRQTSRFSAQRMNAFSGRGCNPTDISWANAIDRGPQTGTPPAFPGDARSQACRDWNAQYGPSYVYGNLNGGLVRGQPRGASATPHPDPASGGARFHVGWNTIMYHIRFPREWEGMDQGILELFIHHPGDEDWTKIMERRDDFPMSDPQAVSNGIELNGGVDGYFHWGIWLTPFRTGGRSEAGVRPSTFVVYDELIASTSPIAAPLH